MHFFYTYIATPQHKNSCHAPAQEFLPGGHEINNFDRPFLGNHYCIRTLSAVCQGVGNTFFTGRLKHELKEISYMTPFLSYVTCTIIMLKLSVCENSKSSIAKINYDSASAQRLRIFTQN